MENVVKFLIYVAAWLIVSVPIMKWTEKRIVANNNALKAALEEHNEEVKKLNQALQLAAAKEEEKAWNIELLRNEVKDLASDDVANLVIEKLKEMGVKIP